MTVAAPQATSPWVPTPPPAAHNRADDALRLFCFPHAGAGANIFHSWQQALGPHARVCAVEYPGRWTRHREPAITDVKQLVTAAAHGLQPMLRGRFAFLGYSFGALLAFELARELRRRGVAGPEHLFVAARRAPQGEVEPEPIHRLPDTAFVQEMDRRYGGIPAAIRNEPDLLALIVPALRADITAIETYRYTPEPPLAIPITSFVGNDDKRIKLEDTEGWNAQTTGAFACHALPGDHFVLTRSAAVVQKIILESIGTPH